MSLLLDALRRRPSTGRDDGAPRTAGADAVLRTLGNPRSRRSGLSLRALVVYAAGAVLLGFVGLSLLIAVFAPPPGQQGGPPPGQGRIVSTPSSGPAVTTDSGPASPDGPASPPTATETPATQPGAPPVDVDARSESVTPSRPAQEPGGPKTADSPPSAPEVDHFGLGLYYQRLRDFERAESHYDSLPPETRSSAAVHNNLGVLLQERGDLDGAIVELLEAIAIDPRYVRAQNNLGVAFLRAGRLEEAASALKIALTTDPRSVASMVNLALVHKAAGRVAEARDLLQRAVAIDARNPGAHYNLAVVADESGDMAAAIEHYRAFLRLGAVAYADLVAPVRARLAALGG